MFLQSLQIESVPLDEANAANEGAMTTVVTINIITVKQEITEWKSIN